MNWLMAARAELYGFSSSVRIGKFLADVAQVIVTQVFVIASEQLSLRDPRMKQIQSRFAIIAYGKLGSREMNYASDLDLVFLHTVSPMDEALVIRLTQKMLHMLTVRSQSGVLYEVDTRLRPSGAAGLLVSHVDAFVAYQKHQAWTWEHQALLKARILTGTSIPSMKQTFLQLKREVLSAPREQVALQKDVVTMRAKIEQHHDGNQLKYTPGGLLDLEFLVQYLVLNQGNPSLARYTHTLSQLQHLFELGVFSKEQFIILRKAYRHYHHVLHQNLLRPVASCDEEMQNQVLAVYQQFLP
jgi:glutamate-ammonia-ligase adenylyltransferase